MRMAATKMSRAKAQRNSLETQRVSAVAGGKLELPGQGVPKLELGNEGKIPPPLNPLPQGEGK